MRQNICAQEHEHIRLLLLNRLHPIRLLLLNRVVRSALSSHGPRLLTTRTFFSARLIDCALSLLRSPSLALSLLALSLSLILPTLSRAIYLIPCAHHHPPQRISRVPARRAPSVGHAVPSQWTAALSCSCQLLAC
eukprot:4730536-Pleurochrysis_carterae.AAC.5